MTKPDGRHCPRGWGYSWRITKHPPGPDRELERSRGTQPPPEPNLHQLSSAFRATLLSSGLGIQVLSSVVPQIVDTDPDPGILRGCDLPSKHA